MSYCPGNNEFFEACRSNPTGALEHKRVVFDCVKSLSPFETCKEEGDYGISILARVPIQSPINFDLHYKDIE